MWWFVININTLVWALALIRWWFLRQTKVNVFVFAELFLCAQTLYLASMLIKALWNNALAAKTQLSKQSSFASLLNTNIPMGNKKGTASAFWCSCHRFKIYLNLKLALMKCGFCSQNTELDTYYCIKFRSESTNSKNGNWNQHKMTCANYFTSVMWK